MGKAIVAGTKASGDAMIDADGTEETSRIGLIMSPAINAASATNSTKIAVCGGGRPILGACAETGDRAGRSSFIASPNHIQATGVPSDRDYPGWFRWAMGHRGARGWGAPGFPVDARIPGRPFVAALDSTIGRVSPAAVSPRSSAATSSGLQQLQQEQPLRQVHPLLHVVHLQSVQ